MRPVTKLLALVVALLWLLPAPVACKREGGAAGNGPPNPLAPFTNSVGEEPSLTLLEGLPHQTWEAAKLKDELAKKRTVQLHAFPFYEQTLPLDPKDASRLKGLLASDDALLPHPPNIVVVKQCGGFHPDYAIRWTAKGRVYDVLLCLGCEEVRCFGPDGEVDCDLSDGALTAFKSILTPYRRNRPARE